MVINNVHSHPGDAAKCLGSRQSINVHSTMTQIGLPPSFGFDTRKTCKTCVVTLVSKSHDN